MSDFSALADETIENIVKFLDPADYSNLSMSNRRMYNILIGHFDEKTWDRNVEWKLVDAGNKVYLFQSVAWKDGRDIKHGNLYLFEKYGNYMTFAAHSIFKFGKLIYRFEYDNRLTELRSNGKYRTSDMFYDRKSHYNVISFKEDNITVDTISKRATKEAGVNYEVERYLNATSEERQLTIHKFFSLPYTTSIETILKSLRISQVVFTEHTMTTRFSTTLSYRSNDQIVSYKETMYLGEDKHITYGTDNDIKLSVNLEGDKILHVEPKNGLYKSDLFSYQVRDLGDRIEISVIYFDGVEKRRIKILPMKHRAFH